jgi:hypothetical protein
MMVHADMELAEQEKLLKSAGHQTRGPEQEEGR